MNPIWLIVALVLALFLLMSGIAWYVSHSLLHPPKRSLHETERLELERTPEIYQSFLTWENIHYIVETKDQISLACYFIPTNRPKGKRKLAIIAHGYSYTHHGSIKYAHMLRELGYDCILFDERNHGNSTGKKTTMGYLESFDLETIYLDALNRFGHYSQIGLVGESMGGASVLLAISRLKQVDFAIVDCPYMSLKDIVKHQLRRRHLPRVGIVPLVQWFFWMATGVTYRKISLLDAVKQTNQPLLFVHGKADGYIPPIHSEMLAKYHIGKHRLYLADQDSHHAGSYRKNPEEYQNQVNLFLQENQL